MQPENLEEYAIVGINWSSLFKINPRDFFSPTGEPLFEEDFITSSIEEIIQREYTELKVQLLQQKDLPSSVRQIGEELFAQVDYAQDLLSKGDLLGYLSELATKEFVAPPASKAQIDLYLEMCRKLDPVITQHSKQTSEFQAKLDRAEQRASEAKEDAKEINTRLKKAREEADTFRRLSAERNTENVRLTSILTYLHQTHPSIELNRHITEYRDQGEYEKGLALCETLLAVDPNNTHAFHFAGTIHEKQEDFDQAVSCYQQVLAAEPGHKFARKGLNRVKKQLTEQIVASREQEDFETCLSHCQMLLQVDQNNTAANYHIGEIYLQTDRPQQAAEYFQKVLATDPHHQPARSCLEQIQITK